jgi:hypothetical protein
MSNNGNRNIRKWRSITIRVPENIYSYLKLMAKFYTNDDISEYVRFLILKDYEKKSQYLEVSE